MKLRSSRDTVYTALAVVYIYLWRTGALVVSPRVKTTERWLCRLGARGNAPLSQKVIRRLALGYRGFRDVNHPLALQPILENHN